MKAYLHRSANGRRAAASNSAKTSAGIVLVWVITLASYRIRKYVTCVASLVSLAPECTADAKPVVFHNLATGFVHAENPLKDMGTGHKRAPRTRILIDKDVAAWNRT